MRMRYNGDININVEFIFDGQSTEVILPKIPESLLPQSVVEAFANEKLEPMQGASEHYEGFNSYGDYITRVFVPSIPFYVASPFKERVFKSSLSGQWLPSGEFPF